MVSLTTCATSTARHGTKKEANVSMTRRFESQLYRHVFSLDAVSVYTFQLLRVAEMALIRQALSLGIIVTSALMIWKALMCITCSESPVVVVLTGSMEPGFKRGDILFLHMSKDPIRTGDIVVFNVEGRDIPIVHRVIEVHERRDSRDVDILTKGDSNDVDDRFLYKYGQNWLNPQHITGRAIGFLPYVGWVTIIMTEKPLIKYILISALGLLVITSKD
ncbi:signal peptidase complex catalytic subunit SEC11A [Manihot esculenta]|uniref:Uncharacterized protein n=2 Tax=Manihot esculenta TaxID=3983 RepID=A0ACB7HJA3_MANES|nr:signal peptidase complex catalytic subunit SEC11A [Manihot esculenta]KAG8652059.1 hypothetical protein MANES_06G049000v8 [Manihot esculenta]